MGQFFSDMWKMICSVFGWGCPAIPLTEYTSWHFIILLVGSAIIIGLIAGAIFLVGLLVYVVFKGLGTFFVNVFSAKKRCSKIQCSTCGRTLDKCTCEKNKNRGNVRRLALYSKEQRLEKRQIKKSQKLSGK